MSTSTFRAKRARYASLTRSRPSDDPELIETRLLMQEEALLRAISKALAKAPPMTDQLRARVFALLPSSQKSADDQRAAAPAAFTQVHQ
jgi:hypothetical protein